MGVIIYPSIFIPCYFTDYRLPITDYRNPELPKSRITENNSL